MNKPVPGLTYNIAATEVQLSNDSVEKPKTADNNMLILGVQATFEYVKRLWKGVDWRRGRRFGSYRSPIAADQRGFRLRLCGVLRLHL